MVRKRGDDQDSSDAGTGNKDLEVLADLPKGFWETLKYFGKGVVGSPVHSFLVIIALLLFAATLTAMKIGGATSVVVLFGMSLLALVAIGLLGARIQKTGLRKEVEPWTEENRADAFVGKVVGDPNRASLAGRKTIGKYLEPLTQ